MVALSADLLVEVMADELAGLSVGLLVVESVDTSEELLDRNLVALMAEC